MSKPIYVVQGSTGQYSDRHDWIVCAFINKEQATTYEQDLTDLSAKYFKGVGEQYWVDPDELPAELQDIYINLTILDPRFQMDYTGTSYWVKEIELR